VLQIEPMSRDIAVDVFDIEVVWILPERSRHRNGLFAAVAPAKAKRAGNWNPTFSSSLLISRPI
jgi:hypothetical protein